MEDGADPPRIHERLALLIRNRGGGHLIAHMTGLDPQTIQRGRQESAAALAERGRKKLWDFMSGRRR
jgi:hypothetical protein